MKALIRAHWLAGLLALTFGLGVAGTGLLALELGRPFGGFVAARDLATNHWYVDLVTPSWWPGPQAGGLRHDARLIEIDGQPFDRDHGQVIAAALARGATHVTVVTESAAGRRTHAVPVLRFGFSHLIDLRLPEFIIFLGFWLLAVLIHRAQPALPVSRVTACAFAYIGLAGWLYPHALFVDSGPPAYAAELIGRGLIFAWLGPLLLHFSLHYPEPSQLLARPVVAGLYVWGAVTGLLVVGARAWYWSAGWSPWIGALDSGATFLCMASLTAGFMANAARLVWISLQRHRPLRLLQQAEISLLGIVSATPLLAAFAFSQIFHSGVSYFFNGLDLRYLLLAAPLALAYVILRYKAFRISHPLFIEVVGLATSALLASLGAWVVQSLLPQPVPEFTLTLFAPIFLVVLLASLTWGTRGTFQHWLDRVFYREQRAYAVARQFGQRLAEWRDYAELPQLIARLYVADLGLEQAAIWLAGTQRGDYQLAGLAGTWWQTPPLTLNFSLPYPPLAASYQMHREPPQLPDGLMSLRSLPGVEVVLPLTLYAHPLGWIALGKRWDEGVFDERDTQAMELMALQASLFLLTARQLEELRQVPRRVAEAQEHERVHIARELHDTVQQFLGRLPFYLEVSRRAAHTHPDETDTLLQRCIADVELAAQTVRQISNNLAPRQLQFSFTRPVHEMVERFRRQTGVDVRLDIAPQIDRGLSLEMRHALYRVVQQALDNIQAHARARSVSIHFLQAKDGVQFEIADDGRGFSEAERQQASDRGSLGFSSMEARVTALSGTFQVRSQPAQGTTVSGWLPSNSLDH